VLLAAVLAAVPALQAPSLLALGGAAVFVLVVGVTSGRAFAIPWAIAGLGAEYALALGNAGLDARVPLYAVSLLVTAELAYWSVQLRGAAADEAGIAQRRVIGLLLGATAALLVCTTLVTLARVQLGGGLAAEAAGLAAAVGALALLLVAVRRTSGA
jgi:hypothetical protein